MAEIIAYISDAHTNSTVGLCPPCVNLDDGGTYQASKAQRWLWVNYNKYVTRVAQIAKQHNASITAIFGGDMLEGDSKNRSKQVITRNKSTILSMTAEVLKPLVDISQRAFFLRGTGAHVGKSAELEEELANDCTIAVHMPDGAASWWSLLAEFDGVLFDAAHHGRFGSTPWGKTNPLNQLAARLIMEYAGRRLPAVAIRSHRHKYGSTYDNYPVMVVQSPAWQLATEYVSSLGMPEIADIGGLIFTCDRGSYTWEKMLFTPELTKPWRLPNKTSGGKSTST